MHIDDQPLTKTDIDWVRRRVADSADVKQAILESEELLSQIARVAHHIADLLGKGGKLLLFGNGGSAADAQHLAAELVGRFYKERRALPALALTANTSVLTCLGNDYDYEIVFSRQIEAHGKEGDIAIGISTSGSSKNICKAVAAANRIGIYTVALTGANRGPLHAMAHECICVPSTETPRIQEAHILIGHIICEWTEAFLFPSFPTTGLAH